MERKYVKDQNFYFALTLSRINIILIKILTFFFRKFKKQSNKYMEIERMKNDQ